MGKKNLEYSIIIPLKDEEGNVQQLHQQVTDSIKRITGSYEIMYIDDGSIDSTYSLLQQLRETDRNIVLIKLRRNFGKSLALDIGFKKARGEYVFTMDGDLQDDPKEFPRFVQKLEEGYELVSGWKKKRHDPISKTLPSKLFNKVTSIFSGLKLHDFNCGFKLYHQDALSHLNIYGELHRYIPVLVHARGFKVAEIPVEHHPRVAGKSKYGFARMFKGLFDFVTIIYLTRFKKRPMHLFGMLGFSSLVVGLGICLYLAILWFTGESIGNRPLLSLGILITIIGTIFFSLGVLGEMILYHLSSFPQLQENEHNDLIESSDID